LGGLAFAAAQLKSIEELNGIFRRGKHRRPGLPYWQGYFDGAKRLKDRHRSRLDVSIMVREVYHHSYGGGGEERKSGYIRLLHTFGRWPN
jgi:hypothetical protein